MKKFLILLLLGSINAAGQDFKWLEGKWRESNGRSYEEWKVKGHGMVGTAYKLDKDGQHTPGEEMSIVNRGENYFFIADVAGPQPSVDFRISSYTKDSFVAENPAHDFPKKISYRKVDEKHLQAVISDNGKKIIRFYFTKLND